MQKHPQRYIGHHADKISNAAFRHRRNGVNSHLLLLAMANNVLQVSCSQKQSHSNLGSEAPEGQQCAQQT